MELRVWTEAAHFQGLVSQMLSENVEATECPVTYVDCVLEAQLRLTLQVKVENS